MKDPVENPLGLKIGLLIATVGFLVAIGVALVKGVEIVRILLS